MSRNDFHISSLIAVVSDTFKQFTLYFVATDNISLWHILDNTLQKAKTCFFEHMMVNVWTCCEDA